MGGQGGLAMRTGGKGGRVGGFAGEWMDRVVFYEQVL